MSADRGSPASAEQNKAAKRCYFEAFNRRDLKAFDELFVEAYTLHATGLPEVQGREEQERP